MKTDRKAVRARGSKMFADLCQWNRLAALLVGEARRLAEALDDGDPSLSPFQSAGEDGGWQQTDLRTAANVLEVFALNVAADLVEGAPLCEPSSLELPSA